MVDYDVHPDGANAVIAATRTNAEEFERLITDLRTAVEDTAGACQSTLIAGALQEVHDGYLAKVATMAWWRSTNVVNEGRKMVDAFVAGDEAMGADAMAEMADVPSSWDDAQ